MAIKKYLGDGVTVMTGDENNYVLYTEGKGSEIMLTPGAVYMLEQFVRELENPKQEEPKIGEVS